jgi:hypothetical protein
MNLACLPLVAAIVLALAGCATPQQNIPASITSTALAAVDRAEQRAGSCPDVSSEMHVREWAEDARMALQANNALMASVYIENLNTTLDGCDRLAKSVQATNEKCRGPLRLGMNALEVRRSEWCDPQHINTTTTAGHEREQWVYTTTRDPIRGRTQHSGYLYLTDGVLTAIQEEAY